MTSQNPITHDLGRVLAGDLAGQAIALVRGLVIPLIVTPARYGLWRILLIVWQYGAYLHLGSFALLNRELPSLFVAGEMGRVSEMRQIAFWGTMTVAFIVAIGLIVFSLSPAVGTDAELLWALRISAVGLLGQQLFAYVMLDFRVRARFGAMSLVGSCQAAAALIFMVPLGYIAGVPGLAGGMALAAVMAGAGFGRMVVFESPRFKPIDFLRQVLKGTPLSALPFLNVTINSVGQIVSASMLGFEAAGFYGIGVMIGTVVYAIPKALGLVLYPRYLASYAAIEDPIQTAALLRRSLRVTSVMSTLAVCGAAILLAPIYHYVFPVYLPALSSNYALLAMMPFLSYALVLQNALLALRLHKRVIQLQVSFIALSAGLSAAGAFAFQDIRWVALGVMVANTGYGLSAMWLALDATRTGGQSTLREFLLELCPIVFVGGVTISMITFWKPSGNLSSWLIVTIGEFLILSPAAVFLVLRLWRNYRKTSY